MIPNRSVFRLFAVWLALLLSSLGLSAAPLTWFPGPAYGYPIGGAAMVTSGGNNIVIGGESYGYGTSTESLAATNIYWTYMSPLPGLQIGPGAVSTGGDSAIVYGGSDGTTATSTVIGYSSSDGSQGLNSMSVARAYLGYAADRSGNAYAIGGIDDMGNVLSSVERYNQDANSWTNITSMPAARFNFPAVFDHTNYIYIFGGYTDTTSGVEASSVLRYSVSGRTWIALASMPVATAGSSAAYGVDGKIYVVGGLSGGVATNVVQVYNPPANTWTISTPLPESLSGSVMGVDSTGRLLVVGGTDSNGNDVADVWRSQQLGAADSAPVFTQYPGTNAYYTNLYTSTISAIGNPQPTYLLVSGPAGMAVDQFSGAITWTPQANQIGVNLITIRATNYAGYADWSYSITITNPRPPVLTNLQVLGATEFSVTLSWAPEDPVAGPVTYSAWLQHVAHSPRGSGVTITYSQIGTNTTNTSLAISGLTPNLSQTYYLKATGSGGTSPYATITATTLGPQPPINFRMTGLTSTTISLAWNPNPGPVPSASYDIWGWYGLYYTVYGTGITNTSFTMTGLTPGTSYQWEIRSHDAAGYASAFNTGFTMVNPVAVSPTIGATTANPDGSFQFSVTEGSSTLQTVLIQATTNPADSNSWAQIGSVLPASNQFTFTDTNASQFPTRFYRVIAP